MERYKVDRLKNGETMVNKYLKKEKNAEDRPVSQEEMQRGRAAIENYESRTRFKRNLEPKQDMMNFAKEYAALKTQSVVQPKQVPISPASDHTTVLTSISKQVPISPAADHTAVLNPNRPFSVSEQNKMLSEFKQRNGNKQQNIYPYGEKEMYDIERAQRDPNYQKYAEKGSRDIFSGYSDGAWGKIKTAAKSMNPNIGLRARHLTDEEQQMYNYLLGKYGREKADDYEEYISKITNERMTAENTQQLQEMSKDNPVAGVGINAVGAMTSPDGYLQAAARSAAGKIAGHDPEVDINSDAFLGNAVMDASNQGIKERIGGTPAKDFLIDTGLSMTQTLARLPLGYAGLAVAGGSAATGAYKDATERGATNEQALLQGAAQGAAEAAFEKISLGNLKAFKEVPGVGARKFITNMAKQAFTEGTEEASTELTNAITDRLIMGDKSNYDTAVQYYISQGLNEAEAKRKAAGEVGENMLLAAAGGALSGGIMGAGAQVIGKVTRNSTESAPTEKLEADEKSQKSETAIKEEIPAVKHQNEEVRPVSNMAEEITMDAEKTQETPDREAWERTKEMFTSLGERGQSAAAENYDGTIEMPEYQEAFNRYYAAGRYNSDIEAAEKAAIAAILTPEQAAAAYKAGAQDRNAALSQPQNYKIGPAKEGGLINHATAATGGQTKFLQAVGKKTGLTFILEDSLESGAIGEYEAKTGTIKISADSKNFLQTNSHELTHFLKDNNPQGYEAYKSVVITSLLEAQNTTLEKLVKNYESAYEKQGQKLKYDEIVDEIVADASGGFLNDEKFIQKVISQDRTVGQKIVDFLSDMIESIKELISRDNVRVAAKGLEENVKNLELAREIWLEEVNKAGESYRSGRELAEPENVKFSVKELDDGTKYVEAEVVQEAFDNLSKSEQMKLAETIINTRFKGKAIGNKPDNAFVKRESAKEYRYPANRTALSPEIANAKARISTELDKLMETAKLIEHIPQDDGRHPGVSGWEHYKVKFKVGGEMYEGVISVGLTERGRVFKDLTKIKNISQGNSEPAATIMDSNDSSGDALNPTVPVSADQKLDGKLADQTNDVSNDSITNQENNIKKFQLEDVDAIDVSELVQENQSLREANEYLEKQLTLTKDYQPRKDDIQRIAGKMLKDFNSTYKKETLVKNLSRLYEYIRSSDHIDGREVTEAATSIARSILNQSQQIDTEMVDKYKGALKDIKETAIRLPESQRGDLDIVGGYTAFRKKYFGKLRLGNTGVDVDTAYAELSGKYPELFPETIVNPADQLLHIANVVDSIRPQISNPYQADIDEMSYMVGQQIFDAYFDVRNLPPTKADRMAAEADRVRREYSKRMEKYRADLKGRYQESLKEVKQQAKVELQEVKKQYENANIKDREQYKQKMQELRDYKNLKIRAEQELYQKRLEERRERTEASQTRKSIIKEVTELQRWLLNPTDKKHVPEGLRKTLAEFLGSIDYSSNRLNQKGEDTERTKSWGRVQKLYAAIANSGGIMEMDDGGTAYIDIDPDIVQYMENLTEQVKNIDKLENLNPKELKELEKTVKAMKHSIQDADKLRANKQYNSIAALAMQSLNDLAKRRNKVERIGLRGGFERLMRSDMLDAYTMFNRFGPAAESIYHGLREGLDKKIRNTKIAQDYMANLMEQNGVTTRDIQEWGGKGAKKTTYMVGGGEINLTPAQVMSLYALNKREQARGHIYNRAGGIKAGATVTSELIKIGGKEVKIGGKIEKSVKPTWVTPADVNKITSTLTPAQRHIADGIVKFFTTQTSEWGNEVSLMLYGYKKFNAPNYFPIKVDRNQLATDSKKIEQGFSTLKNLGETKSTVKNANNPLIIEDIFDVYTRQADAMGSYNAFLGPLSDLQKYYNFKHMDIGNIKQELERTFGEDSHRYIKQLMRDINGVGSGEKELTAPMLRNMKSAAVGFNLSTAIQQPTAYVRALAEIDGKYLAKGLKLHVSDAEWEICQKYAPIARWKGWGYFDINTGRSMKSIFMGPKNTREMLIELSMDLAGKGDEIAWRRLWKAVEAETDDLHPELKFGTEEYYQQCGKRFSEIIDRTQVVDSVLHRCAIMKRDGIERYVTAFMSEPIKSFNMLYRAFSDAALSKQQNGKMDPKLEKRAVQVTGVWILTGATTVLARSIVDAMRDDDDKELIEKYIQAVGENLVDNLNPLNMIPYVKDVSSIFSGYDVGRLDMQGVQQAAYATAEVKKYIAGDSKYTLPGLLYQLAKPISTVTGVAASNLLRDTGGLLNTAIDVFGADSLNYQTDRLIYKSSSSRNTTRYINQAMKAYAQGKNTLGDKIIGDLMESDIDTDKIDSRIKKLLKDNELTLAASEARAKGDYVTYQENVQKLEEAGYGRENIISVIRSQTKALKGEPEESEDEEQKSEKQEQEPGEAALYESADMVYAMDAGNIKAFKEIAETMYKEKKKAGKTSVKARGEMKTALTRQYKQRYLESDRAGRQVIRANLEKLKLDGVQLYKDSDFANWVEEKQKNSKKK